MGGYSERYLENIIRIMEDLSQEAMNRVYEWADAHSVSGIDVFKDWIKNLATRFEEVWGTFDEKDEVDYIEAILQFVASIAEIDPDGEKLPIPTTREVRPKILRMCTPMRKQIDRNVPAYVPVTIETDTDLDSLDEGEQIALVCRMLKAAQKWAEENNVKRRIDFEVDAVMQGKTDGHLNQIKLEEWEDEEG